MTCGASAGGSSTSSRGSTARPSSDQAMAGDPTVRERHAARSTACCCSTRQSDSRPTRRCSARAGSTAPRRPATPERSIRWPAGCCRSASARRPNSRTCCSKATRRYAATVRLGMTTTTGDAEGDPVDERPVRVSRARHRGACLRDFVGRDRADSAAPCGAQVPRTQLLRVRARRHRHSSRRPRSHRSTSLRWTDGAPPDVELTRAMRQGHLRARAGRGPRCGAGLRRASGGAAPRGKRRLRRRCRAFAGSARGAGRGRARCPAAAGRCAARRRCRDSTSTTPTPGGSVAGRRSPVRSGRRRLSSLCRRPVRRRRSGERGRACGRAGCSRPAMRGGAPLAPVESLES